MATTTKLTAAQSHALLDILTHTETYNEIENFKYPGAIKQYGPPFQDNKSKSTSPILQSLLSKFALKLPGLREVKPTFWQKTEDLIQELSEAELSESYDKGILGIRKTLATAISALLEYPARGSLDGIEKREIDHNKKYNLSNSHDVLQSWQDCLQEIVHSDLTDRLFERAAETDDLTKHEPMVQAMHEFIIVNLASLLHFTLVLSPEGPTLIHMIESIHRLLPYVVMRQTLKIGNVATMLSGMMRVILAKASVASVTNWMGWTQGADEGMNLLQQIISQVLDWDKRALRKRAEKIDRAPDGPPKAILDELKDWITRSRVEHEECRRQSRESQKSIITIILSLSSCSDELNEAQHAKAQEYLGLLLDIRDRDQIIKAMCHRNPDHLTAMVREGVDAYTPMIRHIHEAVNLSDTLWDFERFVTDMLKISKPSGPKGEEKTPSVENFVDLLHRHQTSSHKFIHQVAKNGKEVTSWWQDYVHMAAAHFKRNESPPNSDAVVPSHVAQGGIGKKLEKEFDKLSDQDRNQVCKELDEHDQYLTKLHKSSAARIDAVIKRTHSTPYGPGSFLARWQQLLDDTIVTPATAEGPVRSGASKSVKEEGRKDIEGEEAGFITEEEAEKIVDHQTPAAPKVEKVLSCFQQRFREILLEDAL